MSGEPKEPVGDARDVAWLRREVVSLFETAKKVPDPDVASCTKLAELLWKLLPKNATEKQASDASRELDEHRRRVLEAGAPPTSVQ